MRGGSILLVFIGMLTSVASLCAQTELSTMGEQLTDAFRTGDPDKLLACFSSRDEVRELMIAIHKNNGGTGVIGYEVDSVYEKFKTELVQYFLKVLADGSREKIKWKKVKTEETGLAATDAVGRFKMATMVLVLRYKKQYFMIRFPQSFQLDSGWKIGAVMIWEGQVTR